MIRLRLLKPLRWCAIAAALVAVGTGYFVMSAAAAPAGTDPARRSSFFLPGLLPTPVIHQAPPAVSGSPTATFTYSDAVAGVTFHCLLNFRSATVCSPNGITYSNLPPGGYCFAVYVTGFGAVSLPAWRCWRIRQISGQNFIVGGNLVNPLYPGHSEPLDMTFTNPNPVPITIAAGGISAANITVTPGAAGCKAAYFTVQRDLLAAVTIPADTTVPVSLKALGIPTADWPTIKMTNTTSNQDACEGSALTLHYSGIEATG